MLENTLHKIEDLLKSSSQLTESKRQELLNLVAELKAELVGLSQIEREKALQMVQQPQHAKGLERSIEEFELSHPRLYEIIKDLSVSLNGLGV
jgi:hypothetical protein